MCFLRNFFSFVVFWIFFRFFDKFDPKNQKSQVPIWHLTLQSLQLHAYFCIWNNGNFWAQDLQKFRKKRHENAEKILGALAGRFLWYFCLAEVNAVGPAKSRPLQMDTRLAFTRHSQQNLKLTLVQFYNCYLSN